MKNRVIILSCFLVFSQAGNCAEGGYSNYIPGFYGDIALALAPEDGFAFKNDIYYYSADTSKAVVSGDPAINIDIELRYNYATLFFKPDIKLFGGEYAMAVTLPFGGPDIGATLTTGSQVASVNSDRFATGDLTLAPLLLYWSDGNFHYSLAQYVVVPTSNYDSARLANAGLNYWTFETDFIITYFNTDTGQDYSTVIGYNFNTENDDTNYQTGEEFHIDLIFNQFLSENFAIGIQAFHLQQTTKDKGKGAVFGSFKARATGVGPAAMWLPERYNGEVAITAKWINEIDSKNRLEGDHLFLTLAMTF